MRSLRIHMLIAMFLLLPFISSNAFAESLRAQPGEVVLLNAGDTLKVVYGQGKHRGKIQITFQEVLEWGEGVFVGRHKKPSGEFNNFIASLSPESIGYLFEVMKLSSADADIHKAVIVVPLSIPAEK